MYLHTLPTLNACAPKCFRSWFYPDLTDIEKQSWNPNAKSSDKSLIEDKSDESIQIINFTSFPSKGFLNCPGFAAGLFLSTISLWVSISDIARSADNGFPRRRPFFPSAKL